MPSPGDLLEFLQDTDQTVAGLINSTALDSTALDRTTIGRSLAVYVDTSGRSLPVGQ